MKRYQFSYEVTHLGLSMWYGYRYRTAAVGQLEVKRLFAPENIQFDWMIMKNKIVCLKIKMFEWKLGSHYGFFCHFSFNYVGLYWFYSYLEFSVM